jgi:hypothetical protein
MMTHPDFVLQASKDRQERISDDLRALRGIDATERPGKVRRTVGGALITLGERVGGRQEPREPAWSAPRHSTVHLI